MAKDSSQSNASKQGKDFEEIADAFLYEAGFVLAGKRKDPYLGIEFDQVAFWKEIEDENRVLIEHKGSFQGDRPGLMRTDTVKKALLSGFLNKTYKNPDRYFIITSHIQTYNLDRVMPENEFLEPLEQDWNKVPSGLKMLDVAITNGALDAVWVIGDGTDRNLKSYTMQKLREYMETGEYNFWEYVEAVSGRYHLGPYSYASWWRSSEQAATLRFEYLVDRDLDPDYT